MDYFYQGNFSSFFFSHTEKTIDRLELLTRYFHQKVMSLYMVVALFFKYIHNKIHSKKNNMLANSLYKFIYILIYCVYLKTHCWKAIYGFCYRHQTLYTSSVIV